MSWDNLPCWAAALAAGAPRVQLRTWYAAWVEWIASRHEEPTEGIGVSILGAVLGYILAAAARSFGPTGSIPDKGLLSDFPSGFLWTYGEGLFVCFSR